MILVNGCSFSTSASLKEHVQDLIWPNLLASQLDMEVINFAKEGKSNRHICRELFTYLIWAKQEKKELPKYVVMQTSDHFRDHFFNSRYSGKMKPNDFDSQLCRPRHNFHKIYSHRAAVDEKNYNENLGTKLLVKNKKRSRSYDIGDKSLKEPMLRNLIEQISLQNLCTQLNIPLIVFNMFGFDNKIDEDPLYHELDKSNYVISDPTKGMYEHMVSLSFDRPDKYHFNVDGHEFISDSIYDFITDGKTVDHIPYTGEWHEPFDYT